jgi:hypothetical protein
VIVVVIVVIVVITFGGMRNQSRQCGSRASTPRPTVHDLANGMVAECRGRAACRFDDYRGGGG